MLLQFREFGNMKKMPTFTIFKTFLTFFIFFKILINRILCLFRISLSIFFQLFTKVPYPIDDYPKRR